VVLLVPTTLPEPIEGYSLRVAEKWKIGRKGQDNGALFLIAKNDRKMRIETGYGYFAPNVPGGYRLVFELHYPDGRVEYELPGVNSAAAGLRIASLLDEIGRTRYDPLREYMVKALAASVWREYPGVKTVRAVFGSLNLPSPAEFERGKRESYDFLYAYDFSRTEEPAKAENH
jgi:hypothetical protein